MNNMQFHMITITISEKSFSNCWNLNNICYVLISRRFFKIKQENLKSKKHFSWYPSLIKTKKTANIL